MTELKVGQVFKNYQELCKALQLNPCTGKQKIQQMQKIQDCYELKKEGRQFTIAAIKEPPAGHSRIAPNSKYVDFVQHILLSYLSKQKEEIAYVTQQSLWSILGMVNEKYFPMRENKEELLTLDKNMDMFNINNFYQRSNLKFRDIIKSSISSLKRRKIIMCEETFRIGTGKRITSTFESIEYHDASDAEKRYILRVQHDLLKKYDCKDEFELFFKKNKDSYYEELSNIFSEKKGWKNVYFCYKLIFDHEVVTQEINEQEEIMQFNHIIVDTLNTQADNNYERKGITSDNAEDRRLQERNPFFYHEEYPLNQKILSEALIKLKQHN